MEQERAHASAWHEMSGQCTWRRQRFCFVRLLSAKPIARDDGALVVVQECVRHSLPAFGIERSHSGPSRLRYDKAPVAGPLPRKTQCRVKVLPGEEDLHKVPERHLERAIGDGFAEHVLVDVNNRRRHVEGENC